MFGKRCWMASFAVLHTFQTWNNNREAYSCLILSWNTPGIWEHLRYIWTLAELYRFYAINLKRAKQLHTIFCALYSDKTKLFSQSESAQNPHCIINHYKIVSTWVTWLMSSFFHFLHPFRATTKFYDWKGYVTWRSGKPTEYVKRMSKINKKLSADLENDYLEE